MSLSIIDFLKKILAIYIFIDFFFLKKKSQCFFLLPTPGKEDTKPTRALEKASCSSVMGNSFKDLKQAKECNQRNAGNADRSTTDQE